MRANAWLLGLCSYAGCSTTLLEFESGEPLLFPSRASKRPWARNPGLGSCEVALESGCQPGPAASRVRASSLSDQRASRPAAAPRRSRCPEHLIRGYTREVLHNIQLTQPGAHGQVATGV
jgi:hypothetical protein